MTEHTAAAEAATDESRTSGEPHGTGDHGEPHGTGDHGEDHGHDDHGHAEAALGPVDWTAWGAGLLGIVLGLVIVVGLLITLKWVPIG